MRGPLQGTLLKNGKWRVVVTVTDVHGVKRPKTFDRKTTGGHGKIEVTKEFYDFPVMEEILEAFGMGKG